MWLVTRDVRRISCDFVCASRAVLLGLLVAIDLQFLSLMSGQLRPLLRSVDIVAEWSG